MLNEEWIEAKIAKAHEANPEVTKSIIEIIHQLLEGQITDQVLTQPELKTISSALIQGMEINSSESEVKS